MTFRDKRKREWEMFLDSSYYDMFCVRCLSFSKDFNSQLSFHFVLKRDAETFAELLKKAH